MIFKISDKDFFRDNSEALLFPEFKKVGSPAMKYIILVYGYDSPLREMPIDDRKTRAAELAGVQKFSEKDKTMQSYNDLIEVRKPNVRDAITTFQSLQFDFDKDLLLAYEDQLTEFKALMRNKDKSDKQLDQALKVSDKILKLIDVRNEIIKKLSLRSGEDSVEIAALDESSIDDEASEVENFLTSIKKVV